MQSRHVEITGDENDTLIFLPRQTILTTAAEQAASRAMVQEWKRIQQYVFEICWEVLIKLKKAEYEMPLANSSAPLDCAEAW